MKHFGFDNFRVDDTNRDAHAVCRAIAARQPVRPQPVLLISDKGRGKTHLLYAIVNEIRADSTKAGIAYVRAGDFPQQVRDLVKDPSLVQGATEAILLVDSLDGFSRNDLLELEAVVRIFLDCNHSVLLSTCRHPDRLFDLSPDFRRTLNQGKLIRIEPSIDATLVEDVEEEIQDETQAKGTQAVSPDTDRIAQLEGELEEARAQNAKARHEASEVLRRAEMLVEEVQKGRSRFAEAQEEQELQLREIHHLETLLAQADQQSADPGGSATDEDLPDIEALQSRFDEEQRQLRTHFEQSRERLQTQINELSTELEAVCTERGEVREQLEAATAEHVKALTHTEQERDAARERADAIQAEFQAFQHGHSGRRLEHDLLDSRLEEKDQELEDLRNEAARSVAGLTTRNRELTEELESACQELELIHLSQEVVATELQALRTRLVQRGSPPAKEVSTAIDVQEDLPAPPSHESETPPAARSDAHKSLAGLVASVEDGDTLEPLQPLGVPDFDGDAEAPSHGSTGLHHVEQLEDGLLPTDSAARPPRTEAEAGR